MIDPWVALSGALSGALVGFSLGLVGGGGSILAVPLMVYFVGVGQPHVAIGTSALAVAANAAIGLTNHARRGNVNWRAGLFFAAAGVVGALAGSTAGKAFDGQRLLFLFALVMIAVGVVMLRRKEAVGGGHVAVTRAHAAKLGGLGWLPGAFSGFFGIGGGFLIVPGLIAATGMGMLAAVGTSLVAVTAFGLTTAANYALSGLIDWGLAGWFIAGGVLGSLAGTTLAYRLSSKGQLTRVFALLIFAVAAYMLWKSAAAI